MTVAALRSELEREEAVWALTRMRRADSWERWHLVAPLVHEHLPSQSRVRLPLILMPRWYCNLWFDWTQIDGRVEIDRYTENMVHVRGISPTTLALDTAFCIETWRFLDGVLAGTIGDSS